MAASEGDAITGSAYGKPMGKICSQERVTVSENGRISGGDMSKGRL